MKKDKLAIKKTNKKTITIYLNRKRLRACLSELHYYYYYTRLMAFFQDNLGKPVPKGKTKLDLNEARDDAVAST